MAGQKTEFHEAPSDIFRNVQAIQGAGFTFFEMGQRQRRDWGISPTRTPIDTQLHRGISIRTVIEHVEFPKTSPRLIHTCPSN
jgi:hypothetical protein